MAKKQKQKKTGMVKRKQQKQHKKLQERRRVSSRAPQQVQSYKDVQKILAMLPSLAFDPALIHLKFDLEALKAKKEAGLPDPVIIEQLITPEFVEHLHGIMTEMELANTAPSVRYLLAKAVVYSLDNPEETPLFMHPLIVAIYLRCRAEAEEISMQLPQLKKALLDYESTHSELLEQLMEKSNPLQNEEEIEMEIADENVPVPAMILDPSLLETFYQTLNRFSETEQNRMQEDVEVLVEDYASIPPSEWDAEWMRTFLGEFFIDQMNPSEEDLQSMQNTLQHFLPYLAEKQVISEATLQEIMPILKDQETYRRQLSATVS